MNKPNFKKDNIHEDNIKKKRWCDSHQNLQNANSSRILGKEKMTMEKVIAA